MSKKSTHKKRRWIERTRFVIGIASAVVPLIMAYRKNKTKRNESTK